MAKLYYDSDANLNALQGKVIAIAGYGSQGHAHAQNLRESGIEVIVAEKEGTPNYAKAIEDGFTPMTVAEATQKADYIQLLLPDEMQAVVYAEEVAPYLEEGMVLGFSHGFNIHYGQIVPPAGVDVVMVAPKGPGHLVRRTYTEGSGVPSLVAVYQDASGEAFNRAMAYAKANGAGRSGILTTTFQEETETDLFGEQVVLCGGLSHLIKAGFETLVEAGYQPESAYFECLHEVKLIADLIYENGITMMRYSISDTAQWGDMVTGPRIITDETKATMKQVLAEIQDGTFASNWIAENKAGRAKFKALDRIGKEHQIETVGKELRAMMPWIQRKY